MKKALCFKSILAGFALAALFQPIHAQNRQAKEKLREETRMFQEGRGARDFATGAAAGAVAGGIYGGAKGAQAKDGITRFYAIPGGAGVGAVAGATMGGLLNMIYQEGLRIWQLAEINSPIRKYTKYRGIGSLSLNQAMLFIAAYKRNITQMQRLIRKDTKKFVDQEGVWKALTQLFFNKTPNDNLIEKLKSAVYGIQSKK